MVSFNSKAASSQPIANFIYLPQFIAMQVKYYSWIYLTVPALGVFVNTGFWGDSENLMKNRHHAGHTSAIIFPTGIPSG